MSGDNNRKVFREQIVGLLILTVIVVIWSYFFIPSPPKTPIKDSKGAIASEGEKSVSENTGVIQATEKIEFEKKEVNDSEAVDKKESLSSEINLPPEPKVINEEANKITLSKEDMEVTFTKVGARVKYLKIYLKPNQADVVQLIPLWKNTPDKDAVYPFGLRFHNNSLGDILDTRLWDVQINDTENIAQFSYTIPNYIKVEKIFSFGASPFTLDLRIRISNLSPDVFPKNVQNQVDPVFSLNWGPNINSGDKNKGVPQTVIFERKGELLRYVTSKIKPKPNPDEFLERVFDLEWAAIRSAYFVVAFKPEFKTTQGWITGGPKHFRVGVGATQYQVAPNETQEFLIKTYIGPNRGPLLAAAWAGLDQVWEFFTSVKIMDKFAKLLLAILNFFYTWTIPNYGVAIIFLTILVRLVVFPLTWKSMVSMKRMQKLAPEMEKLKAEVGDNQQELQKRMMELYRERGVSPLGGCLPLFLQLPVFIALYRMLWSAVELRGAPFIFWMADMSQPDHLFSLPFSIPIPFSGGNLDSINLLPILMGVLMYVSQKLTPGASVVQTQQQRIMMTIMPIFFTVICYNMASGLSLYIIVSTLLGIAQNYLVPIKDVEITPKKVSSSRKHFYTAAQERKRQWAKELRRERKLKQRKTNEDED
ncbi:MAG TPA: membrane protein insertase YidC [Candidatus Hydrogenedens sp.]|nr:membrane protein insertase YidC [Candidatus Hydrogenedens sp.]